MPTRARVSSAPVGSGLGHGWPGFGVPACLHVLPVIALASVLWLAPWQDARAQDAHVGAHVGGAHVDGSHVSGVQAREPRDRFIATPGYKAAAGLQLSVGAGLMAAGTAVLALPDECVARADGRCRERRKLTPAARAGAGSAIVLGAGLVATGLYFALFARRMPEVSRSDERDDDADARAWRLWPEVNVGSRDPGARLRLWVAL